MEAGNHRLPVLFVARILSSVGLEIGLKAWPGSGVGLRDSGQLALAGRLRDVAHPSFRVGIEVPTSDDGKQAADMVFIGPDVAIHLELEAGLSDFQAQLRAGHLKRDALARRYARPVAFVMALSDTQRNRAAVKGHATVIRDALPASSREVMRAIREAVALDRDGLLWLRPGIPKGMKAPTKGRVPVR